jgi:hypothetical protein
MYYKLIGGMLPAVNHPHITRQWFQTHLNLDAQAYHDIVTDPKFREITNARSIPDACRKFNSLNDVAKWALLQEID